jgi:uncharacterized membrane-anchored protein YitT (DUF2179 family)
MLFHYVILLSSSLLYVQVEMILYTLIHLYVSSHFVNFVVTGLSQRKALTIISTCWQEISDSIKNRLRRGVAITRGEGGYTGRVIKILYTVVTIRELSRFKEMIREIDPKAFWWSQTPWKLWETGSATSHIGNY